MVQADCRSTPVDPACPPRNDCPPVEAYTCTGFLPEVGDEIFAARNVAGDFQFRYFAIQ